MKWIGFAATALGCVTAGTAAADNPDSQTPEVRAPFFEVTPFAGYRFGGGLKLLETGTHVDVHDHPSFALTLGVSTDRESQYELFYSRQSTSVGGASLPPADMVIEYLHFGGTVRLDDSPRLQPYLIGSVGGTRFDPSSAIGRHSTYLSASMGGGLRIPFNRHLSLRLEARGFATLLHSKTAVFCRSDESGGLCRIQGRGSAFVQADILAGAAYGF